MKTLNLWKTSLLGVLFLALGGGFTSCKESETDSLDIPSWEITLPEDVTSSGALLFDAEAPVEKTVTLTVKGTGRWTITGDTEFCGVNPTSGNGSATVRIQPQQSNSAVPDKRLRVTLYGYMFGTEFEVEHTDITVKFSFGGDVYEEPEPLYFDDFNGESISGNTNPADFNGWRPSGTAAGEVTYSGTNITIRTTGDSTTNSNIAGEVNKDQKNNVFFGNNATFIIGNLKPVEQNLHLRFAATYAYYGNNGIDKTVLFDKERFHLSLSADGATWSEIDYDHAEKTTGAQWDWVDTEIVLSEVPAALYIKFASDVNNYRIDDVLLTVGDGTGQQVDLANGGNGGGSDTPGGGDEVLSGFESQSIFVVTDAKADNKTDYSYVLSGYQFNKQKATGIKLGKSGQQGRYTSDPVGVEGDKVLSLYGIAWNASKNVKLYIRVNNGGSVEGDASHDLIANSTTYNNNTDVTVSDSDYMTFQLKGLTPESTITFSTSETFEPAAVEGRAILARIRLTDTDEGGEGEGGSGGGETETPVEATIGEITAAGNYSVAEATVVAAGTQAYVIADNTGAMLVYHNGHERKVGDKISISGDVTIYSSLTQFTDSAEVTVISTGNEWTYNPEEVKGATFDALTQSTACQEIQFSGNLAVSGNYLNITLADATNKGSLRYVSASDYSSFDGKDIVVKGYFVGTSTSAGTVYINVLPYSVTEVGAEVPGPGPDPEEPEVKTITIPELNAKAATNGSTKGAVDKDTTYEFTGVVCGYGEEDGLNYSFGTVYVMAKDATTADKNSGIVLYNTSYQEGAYKFGDEIKVTLEADVAQVYEYNGLAQITDVAADKIEVTGNTTVEPVVLTSVSQLADYYSMLVKFENVTSSASDTWANAAGKFTVGGDALTLYFNNRCTFRSEKFSATTGSITGISANYKGALQLLPRCTADVEDFKYVESEQPGPETPSDSKVTVVFGTYGWANAAKVTTVEFNGGTITFAKDSGSNDPAYYTADSDVRLYAKNTFTIETEKTMVGIKLTNTAGNGSKELASVTATPGTYTADTDSWAGEATSVTFTLGASGQRRIQTIEITFEGGEEEDPGVTPGGTTYTLIDKVEDLTVGTYYLAGYLTNSTGSGATDFSANPYHLWQGTVNSGDAVTSTYSYDASSQTLTLADTTEAVEIELVAAGSDNTYYIVYNGQYLTSTSNANRKLAMGNTQTGWTATNNTKGGISLSEGNVYLGTANAASKILRTYTNEGTLSYGAVFFKKN